MTFDIRPAGQAHGHLLTCLHGHCFPDSWGAAEISGLLATPGAFALLAVDGSADDAVPIGFVLARAAGGECEIITICVLADARRQGAASGLVRAATGEAAARGAVRVFLEVAENNDAALSLYSAEGFEPVGRRKGYYRGADGQGAIDAIVMGRRLN